MHERLRHEWQMHERLRHEWQMHEIAGARMTKEEKERKFRESRQESVRLEIALEAVLEDGADTEEMFAAYIRRRIRPAVERLMGENDIDGIWRLEKLGWFGERELSEFIVMARRQRRKAVWLWLLQLKERKYGFHDRDFSL